MREARQAGLGKVADDLDFRHGEDFQARSQRGRQINRRDETGGAFAADHFFPLLPAADLFVFDDGRFNVLLQAHCSQPQRNREGAAQIAHGDGFAAKFLDGGKILRHDELQPAVDLGGAQKKVTFLP